MTEKRLRAEDLLPPPWVRRPEEYGIDPSLPSTGEAIIILFVAVAYYSLFIGAGIVIGWLVWG